jgi:hypothetical protein
MGEKTPETRGCFAATPGSAASGISNSIGFRTTKWEWAAIGGAGDGEAGEDCDATCEGKEDDEEEEEVAEHGGTACISKFCGRRWVAR